MAGLTNLNPFVIVKCADPTSVSSEGLVFDDKKMVVAQGKFTLATLDFADFFQPCTGYLIQSFSIPAGGSVYVEPGNMTDLKFIVIRVDFPDADGTNEDLKWLTFQYPSGGQTMYMGRLTVLSGATGHTWDFGASPGGLDIMNPQGFAVNVKVLLLA
jgi:hypothetical protein